MADSSKEAVAVVEESVWGTTPASALTQAAYITGVSGGLERSTERTNSLRSNYVRPTTVLTGDQGNLTLNHEWAYGDIFDLYFLEGLLRSDWSSAQSVTATDISFASSDNSMSSTGETLTVFPAGTWVRVAGTTYNDGLHFVITSTTSKLTFGSQTTIVDEGAGSSFTVDNDGYIRNGSTPKSYTVERNFASQSSTPFRAQKGLRVSSMSIDIAQGIITGSTSLMGLDPSADAAATAGSGAYTAAVTTEPYSGANNFGTFLEGAASYSGQVQSLNLSLSAGARPQMQLGSTSPFGVGSNAYDFSGSMSVYKDDNSDSIYTVVRSFAARFLSFTLTDTAGNKMVCTVPQIKYTGGNPDNSGNDSDIYQALSFAVDEHPTYGYLIQFDKFAA